MQTDFATVIDNAQAERPPLPLPTRARWQPLRLGLVELFHYDSEEFWFRDGHLLLRGNNGTGKSKVLSLTLPFLFDAQLKSSRIEPDGDAGKKMAWNLLMNSYDRRVGYAWIEFGRLADDGTPRYLTLGAGLSAAAARPQVESWFFVLEDSDEKQSASPGGHQSAPRINRDLWLTNEQRVVLGKERLREALAGHGQVFESGGSYRRAVDERLFHLGPKRYEALMDTLIQLRQPQLSKKPDESALSHALTEALPPLAAEMLGDVAEALGQLEEDRRQLGEYQALAAGVGRFDQRYRVYAGAQSRRQARVLRQAQTEFDGASRQRSEALARLQAAESQEALASAAHQHAELALLGQRTRVDTLLADPAMQDANRLDGASAEAAARAQAQQAAQAALADMDGRLRRSVADTRLALQRAVESALALDLARQRGQSAADAAGVGAEFAANVVVASAADLGAPSHQTNRATPPKETEQDASAKPDTLAAEPRLITLAPRDFDAALADLRRLVRQRREQIILLRRRHAELALADAQRMQRQQARDDSQLAFEAAAEQREQADTGLLQESQALQAAWTQHLESAVQLRSAPAATELALAGLTDWALSLDGPNPAWQALQQAQQTASQRLAARGLALAGQRQDLAQQQSQLQDEQAQLLAGVDAPPPAPYTRQSNLRLARAGAPFWQLVDFQVQVSVPHRAGLEAALEAVGLLDAWVTPDGLLHAAAGAGAPPLQDTQWLTRPAGQNTLAHWLRPAVVPQSAVPVATVERLLSSLACGDLDPVDAEAWVAPDGRYRLGALVGAWAKPAAGFIGFAARAAARALRLSQIDALLAALHLALATLQTAMAAHQADERHAAHEWASAPADARLRQAHLLGAQCARDYQAHRAHLSQADEQLRQAGVAAHAARQTLQQDANDQRLPAQAEALPAIDDAVQHFDEAQQGLTLAARDARLAAPDLQRQQLREAEVRADWQQRGEHLATSQAEAQQAHARLQALRDAVGALVGELQRQLTVARQAVSTGEKTLKTCHDAQRQSGEARAVASSEAGAAEATLAQRFGARASAAVRWQQFVATGLLAAALPTLALPNPAEAWPVDAALNLARRAEQGLLAQRDDDEAWARVQRQINEELTELQRALAALGHQAPAETSDFGLIVNILYQNKPERPDQLTARLSDEIIQRGKLLSAHESAVLENHLQAEIAADLQRLLHAAERQVQAINKELHKRPTSTGVRFRLLWLPLTEEEGAPVGLHAARRHLLNTSADLWSPEDRRVVGTLLQQRISAERERSDAGLGRDGGGSLLEQLARALDYRSWHRFRVERWQDGQWRKLSGPASSGERALGLTVPLFAAVASFYSQSGYALAPRLMLLDEAFAGIDDAARAHCMALIREFDLDFVITSEREWACYAELPGVAICQLQRREGVDAVFVSRWTWDGRAKQRDADPNQRFAPEPALPTAPGLSIDEPASPEPTASDLA